MDDNQPLRPDLQDAPVLFAFGRYRIFSLQFLRYIGLICIGLLLGTLSTASESSLKNPHFRGFMLIYLSAVAFLLIGRRLYMHWRGGVAPFTFTKDGLVLPSHVHSRRLYTIPYDQILSVSLRGTKKRNLLLDTQKRAFLYPLREFAEPDAGERITQLLQERILKLPDGPARWQAMTEKQASAGHLSARKTQVTWWLAGVLALIFAFQLLWIQENEILGTIDLGANAASLTLGGQWYRLVTANLLHANFSHIFNNLLFLLIIGAMAERLFGARRYLMLLLTTGILSQLASALWHHFMSSPGVFSVGVSGPLFGLLGALAVFSHHFKGKLPGGFRLNKRFWWYMLGFNFILTPALLPGVDTAAHIGGFISGICIGWLLCRNQVSALEHPRLTARFNGLLTLLLLVWGISLAVAFTHASSPDVRRQDHRALAEADLASSKSDPGLENEVAWSIACDPAAMQEELKDAEALARHMVELVEANPKIARSDVRASLDTLATLHYRLNQLDAAIDAETRIFTAAPDTILASQLARFLERYRQVHGVRLIGAASESLPQISLNLLPAKSFRLSVPRFLPAGARIFALLHQAEKPLGLLSITLPPNGQPLLIPEWKLPPNLILPHSGALATLTLLEFDAGSCNCKVSDPMNAFFFTYDKHIMGLP